MKNLSKFIPIIVLIGLEAVLYSSHRDLFTGLLPVVVITIITILYSLNNPVGHSKAFRIRSYFNWLTLGLTYAFLYMGRYNLTKAKTSFSETLMSKDDFGMIFGVGAIVYGVSFIINGPLTDKLGGKKTMIIGATGSAISNLLLGFFTYKAMNATEQTSLFVPFVIIYAINMYFQSFGAVSIVKVNSAWFHLKERGVFGGIFGTLISLGLFLAFDLTAMILRETKEITGSTQIWWVFFVPAIILFIFVILDFFIIKDTPGEAGFEDFNTGDAGADDKNDNEETVFERYKRILTHPIIIIMVIIEFSSGVVRNGITHWGALFASDTLLDKTDIVFRNWGLFSMIAGITGGFFAGFISDKFFQSRRGPSAFFLYVAMFLGFSVMVFAVKFQWYHLIGLLTFFLSLAVIGVHGMLSGTASMDFGGKKSAATVAGVIDGFVYLGTGFQSIVLGKLLSGAKDNFEIWNRWPVFLIPFTLIGVYFTWRIWSAVPDTKGRRNH